MGGRMVHEPLERTDSHNRTRKNRFTKKEPWFGGSRTQRPPAREHCSVEASQATRHTTTVDGVELRAREYGPTRPPHRGSSYRKLRNTISRPVELRPAAPRALYTASLLGVASHAGTLAARPGRTYRGSPAFCDQIYSKWRIIPLPPLPSTTYTICENLKSNPPGIEPGSPGRDPKLHYTNGCGGILKEVFMDLEPKQYLAAGAIRQCTHADKNIAPRESWTSNFRTATYSGGPIKLLGELCKFTSTNSNDRFRRTNVVQHAAFKSRTTVKLRNHDTHKIPFDRVERCRERQINIKAPERVKVNVTTQNKRQCPQHSQTQFSFPPWSASPSPCTPLSYCTSFVRWSELAHYSSQLSRTTPAGSRLKKTRRGAIPDADVLNNLQTRPLQAAGRRGRSQGERKARTRLLADDFHGDAATLIKCAIAATRRALNWRALFSSYWCTYGTKRSWRSTMNEYQKARRRRGKEGTAIGSSPILHRPSNLVLNIRFTESQHFPVQSRVPGGSYKVSFTATHNFSEALLKSYFQDIPPPHTRSLPDFRTWESCRAMPLAGRFSRGPPAPHSPHFTLNGSQDLDPTGVKLREDWPATECNYRVIDVQKSAFGTGSPRWDTGALIVYHTTVAPACEHAVMNFNHKAEIIFHPCARRVKTWSVACRSRVKNSVFGITTGPAYPCHPTSQEFNPTSQEFNLGYMSKVINLLARFCGTEWDSLIHMSLTGAQRRPEHPRLMVVHGALSRIVHSETVCSDSLVHTEDNLPPARATLSRHPLENPRDVRETTVDAVRQHRASTEECERVVEMDSPLVRCS
ncbi:hypothetical protein PR048_027918 [Dryococelus australis]|uniref:Uncharacterized protein n=1 Tax=Dryococelus australis TaxID=614101 RepID=A0ABQ9GHT4_9NEOP|nr:hypothetical protein PR048_027918 [Dryococelus australis]